MDCGIDVLSMRGLSLRKCLELCAMLDKKVAALRDNDGNQPQELRECVEKLLVTGRRELFVGSLEDGETLEPQLISKNGDKLLREILGLQRKSRSKHLDEA